MAFYHVKRLLNHDLWIHSKLPMIQKALGIKSRNRAETCVRRWQSLDDSTIPLTFIESIGLTIQYLERAFELDRQAYLFASRQPLRVSGIQERLMACVYRSIKAPIASTNVEATLNWVVDQAWATKRLYAIAFDPPIQSAGVNFSGELWVAKREPSMRVSKQIVEFLIGNSPAGRRTGFSVKIG